MPEWEEVTADTSRLAVPGGWLYRVQLFEPSGDSGREFRPAVAVQFVSDERSPVTLEVETVRDLLDAADAAPGVEVVVLDAETFDVFDDVLRGGPDGSIPFTWGDLTVARGPAWIELTRREADLRRRVETVLTSLDESPSGELDQEVVRRLLLDEG